MLSAHGPIQGNVMCVGALMLMIIFGGAATSMLVAALAHSHAFLIVAMVVSGLTVALAGVVGLSSHIFRGR